MVLSATKGNETRVGQYLKDLATTGRGETDFASTLMRAGILMMGLKGTKEIKGIRRTQIKDEAIMCFLLQRKGKRRGNI